MFKSLRSRLFVWFFLSLSILAVFFYVFVHELAWSHGTHVFIILFIALASTGFLIIYRITKSLDNLAGRIRTITYKNLDERIVDIKGDDEIGLLAKTFNTLLDRLDETFKREQQFIADVTHELKTPIATLRSSLELGLEKKRTSEEYQKTLAEAVDETHQLSKTLNNILELAWSDSPEETIIFQKINLSILLEELTEIAQKLAVAKKIQVTSKIAKEVYISGIRDRLAKGLLNIIDNAIKYSGQNGKLFISLEAVHDKAIIIIKDNGAGIAKEDLTRIFDRFYRGLTTSKTFGSGLGLAISKSIINLHKGDIKVNSIVSEGTTFTISIPVA